MSEPSDQLLPYNRFVLPSLGILIIKDVNFSDITFGFGSELIIIFLKFLYDQDPIKQLLDISETDYDVEIDL